VIRWVVINDPAKVHWIAEMNIEWMKIVNEKNPPLYEEVKLELLVEPWELGQDRISREAPCIIMASARKTSGRPLRRPCYPE
jgi:hypothetical protein